MDLLRTIIEIIVGTALCLGVIVLVAQFVIRRCNKQSLSRLLSKHFGRKALSELTISERLFPVAIRADLQRAIEDFLQSANVRVCGGVPTSDTHEGIDLAPLLGGTLLAELDSKKLCPHQYEELDIGEDQPERTLKSGIWLATRDGIQFAVLYCPHVKFTSCGCINRMRLQVVAPHDDRGLNLIQQFFGHLESAVLNARCYRGKVLSFDQEESYFGEGSGLKVHRLGRVARDEVILPAKTGDTGRRNAITSP